MLWALFGMPLCFLELAQGPGWPGAGAGALPEVELSSSGPSEARGQEPFLEEVFISHSKEQIESC